MHHRQVAAINGDLLTVTNDKNEIFPMNACHRRKSECINEESFLHWKKRKPDFCHFFRFAFKVRRQGTSPRQR